MRFNLPQLLTPLPNGRIENEVKIEGMRTEYVLKYLSSDALSVANNFFFNEFYDLEFFQQHPFFASVFQLICNINIYFPT